jgi:hypothetical protein
VGIPKGFPKSVGRVGSRLHGFPCFPYSVISMACFSLGDAGFTATSTSAMGRTRNELFVVIVVEECFVDNALIDRTVASERISYLFGKSVL